MDGRGDTDWNTDTYMKNKLKPLPKNEAYGLWISFKFWIFGIEIWRKGLEEK
jgi:hypothetical protein